MITINNKTYLEIKDVMKLLNITHSRVSALVMTKKLDAFKPSPRKTYFSEEMIQKYIEGR